MSDGEDNVESMASDVFKHELKASEKINTLFSEHEPQEAEDALVSSFINLCDKIEDPNRLTSVVQLMNTLAGRLGSEKMEEAAFEVAEESEYLNVRDD